MHPTVGDPQGNTRNWSIKSGIIVDVMRQKLQQKTQLNENIK